MAKGGTRSGAGRPKGRKNNKTLQIEEARVLLREMIFEELEPITRAQLDLAQGAWYEDARGRVYRTKPDRGAAELLLAHAIGKPREIVEQTGKIVLRIDI